MSADPSFSWSVAWRRVTLHLSALRGPGGEPRFEIHWSPEKPDRLRGPEIAAFQSGYKNAKGALLAYLASTEGST